MARYLCVERMLAENESVPVVLPRGIASVARQVDPTAPAETMPENTRVEAPFWMVPALAARHLATAKVPKAVFGCELKSKVEADPGCVNLRERSAYFYELALMLVDETHRRTPGASRADSELFKLTRRAFEGRYQQLLVKALNCSNNEATLLLPKLTSEERALFERARAARAAYRTWHATKEPRLTASRAVATGKRKASGA